MEEGSRWRVLECANMTVTKHSHTNETSSSSSYNDKLIHTNQCTFHEEETKVLSDGETERNILCHVDDPDSSPQSQVENLCLLDNIGETERDRVCVEPFNQSEEKENRNSPTHARTGDTGEDLDVDCQQTNALASSSGSLRESTVMSAHHADDDEEIFRRAREEGQVNVVFPGRITQDGCCRLVCELLKCVLYQRQQMPMTYDQMVFLLKQQHNTTQAEDTLNRRSAKTSGLGLASVPADLQELDEVLTHLEALFSLSHVPRVLFLLGGSIILPTELYEVNMEAVAVGAGENRLRSSSCLRQLFRTLFVADLLSDAKSVRLMTTTVLALGHRDCGVTGFKPKVDFKLPTKVKRQVISIASDLSLSGELEESKRDLEDYIWFQAPVTVKGFCK